jgi:protoporphyrinogen IX oxidase
MLYLWIKALHLVFVMSWFAGLLYLPRLFVYHADTRDSEGDARFRIMERRLFALMTLAAVLAVLCGATLLLLQGAWLAQRWLHWKLVLVGALVVYHIWCARLLSGFRDGRNTHSSRWYRYFNELPAVLLLLIVLLAVIKPL